MSTLSECHSPTKRRRHSPDFKAQIVSQCQQPGASVSRIALDNRLNANMVRRWIREADRADSANLPAFVSLSLPAVAAEKTSPVTGYPIRIEIPRPDGSLVVEWPANQADQCLVLLRELLR